MVYFTYTVEERETNYCTGVWKRNWYKMWCNKYKKFRFDRWAIKKTVQKFVFVHYTELDCCYTITSLYKAQPWGCSPDGKLRSAARGHGTFFAQSRADSHSYLCQKKNRKQQHLGHFPKKQKNKNKTCPALSTFQTERRKVTTQFKFRCYYKKKRYPFWNNCLMYFLYTFLYDLAKLCSDKLCKSAFQKSLAKTKKRKPSPRPPQKKTSIKVVTVHNITEMNCIWAVVTTARMELKADQQYFKTAPVITSWAPPSTIQITVTARRRCGRKTLSKTKVKIICLVV